MLTDRLLPRAGASSRMNACLDSDGGCDRHVLARKSAETMTTLRGRGLVPSLAGQHDQSAC